MSVSKEQYQKVMSRLQAACVKREYCSGDISRKAREAFAKLELPADECRALAAQMLEELVADKFVSDLRYAAAFAREKSSLSGWGPVKISFALRAKGVPQSVIADALEEIDDTAADARLERLLEAKWKLLKDDPQGKLKLLRFALSRGYDYSTLEPVVARITKSAE